MTGLGPSRHLIVEIATLLTDDNLELIAEGPDLVVHATEEELSEMADVVVQMHTKSGLIDQIRASQDDAMGVVADIANAIRDGKLADITDELLQREERLDAEIAQRMGQLVDAEQNRMARLRDSVDAANRRAYEVELLAAVMGLFAAVGLGALGVPYFYVVALVAALGETIPIVGPVIVGVTAVAVASTVSAKLALGVGAFFLVLHQLEANVLVPKVMEKRVGVSPVAVMVALLIGGALWGIVGAILAIPTAAILSVIVEDLAASHQIRIQRVR